MMKIFSRLMIAVSVLFLSHLSHSLEGCTGLKIVAKDGFVVHGRTLEFGIPLNPDVVVVPRGMTFKSQTPLGPGMAYQAKYAAVGAMTFDHIAIMDGMNEKGLAVGVFYFPGFAGYTPTTSENQSMSLAPYDFSNWLITQFATLDEVKQGLESVFIAPTIDQSWGQDPAPFHYIVYDSKGKALVIEPIGGKLKIYDNPLGTFTNSPTFDWHITNLRNYINLNPVGVKPIAFNGVNLAPFGQGSGLVGLPGDFSPPSRFVRAAIFSTTAIPSDNVDLAVLQLFHLLNQFDIPIGAVRSVVNGVTYSDLTWITSVKNPKDLKYYFKTYADQSIRMVDLKKFDLDAKTVKRTDTSGGELIVDITSTLK